LHFPTNREIQIKNIRRSRLVARRKDFELPELASCRGVIRVERCRVRRVESCHASSSQMWSAKQADERWRERFTNSVSNLGILTRKMDVGPTVLTVRLYNRTVD
jgi:hypothetical protein